MTQNAALALTKQFQNPTTEKNILKKRKTCQTDIRKFAGIIESLKPTNIMDEFTETITCECGTVFQWTNDGDEFMREFTKAPSHCNPCSERLENEREAQRVIELQNKKAAELASRLEHIKASTTKSTPLLFRGTDTSHPKFNLAGWNHVKDWKPSAEKPWLGLIGETGTSKSRIAYLLAGKELEWITESNCEECASYGYPKYATFEFWTSYEIADAAMKLHTGSFDQKEQARTWFDDCRKADLLLIDDLGKGRMTPAVNGELFALIDHRYQHQLRTIWTSNSTPEEIAANMSKDMAAPFAGRLNECSRIIRFQ